MGNNNKGADRRKSVRGPIKQAIETASLFRRNIH